MVKKFYATVPARVKDIWDSSILGKKGTLTVYDSFAMAYAHKNEDDTYYIEFELESESHIEELDGILVNAFFSRFITIAQDDLKKCPFCGGDAELADETMFYGSPDSVTLSQEIQSVKYKYVRCKQCDAQSKKIKVTDMNDAIMKATHAWNCRM